MNIEQLDDLRELVRGPLSRMGRNILSALIVIEVHARDVVTNMVDEEVCNVNDFEWISQLRSVCITNMPSWLLSCFVVWGAYSRVSRIVGKTVVEDFSLNF